MWKFFPLEKFNLDRVKPDGSKKEEEERRRNRLLPRTFMNWLQTYISQGSGVEGGGELLCAFLLRGFDW